MKSSDSLCEHRAGKGALEQLGVSASSRGPAAKEGREACPDSPREACPDSPDGLGPQVVVEALQQLGPAEGRPARAALDVQVRGVGQGVHAAVRAAGDVELDRSAGPQPLRRLLRANANDAKFRKIGKFGTKSAKFSNTLVITQPEFSQNSAKNRKKFSNNSENNQQ